MRRVPNKAVGVLPDQRYVITEGDPRSDCQGMGNHVRLRPGRGADTPSSHWNVVGLRHSSLNAVTSSCVPESSLAELGAAGTARAARPGQRRCARTPDHLRHVFGIASRTRPLGAACDHMRHDLPSTAYALVRAISGGGARCWIRPGASGADGSGHRSLSAAGRSSRTSHDLRLQLVAGVGFEPT